MAWPHDARNVVFAANSEILSTHMNEVQDRIIQLNDVHSLMEVTILRQAYILATADDGSIPVGTIYSNINFPAFGVQHIGVNADGVWYQLRARVDLVLNSLIVKWKNGGGGAASNTFSLYQPNLYFGTSTTAPVLGAAIDTVSPAAAAGAWESVSMTAIAATMSADDILLLHCEGMANGDLDTPEAGDFFAGVQCTVTAS